MHFDALLPAQNDLVKAPFLYSISLLVHRLELDQVILKRLNAFEVFTFLVEETNDFLLALFDARLDFWLEMILC